MNRILNKNKCKLPKQKEFRESLIDGWKEDDSRTMISESSIREPKRLTIYLISKLPNSLIKSLTNYRLNPLKIKRKRLILQPF